MKQQGREALKKTSGRQDSRASARYWAATTRKKTVAAITLRQSLPTR
jgi:hypothetical protein